MDMLKKYFPFSFQEKKDITALVINIVIYLVVGLVAGALIGLLAVIPVLGIIFGLIGSVIGLYALVGIVFTCLDYFKLLK